MEKIKIRNNPDNPNQYVITSTELNIWDHFLYKYKSKDFNFATRRWSEGEKEDTVSEDWDGDTFRIYKGFAIYVYNTLLDYLDDESIDLLKHDIWCDASDLQNFDFTGLRDDQKSIVEQILKYRRSIVQVPTGFGKTEIIARLIINFIESDKKVLVTTGVGKVVEEIKLRVWKYRPDIYIPNYWDSESKINIIYPNGFANSNSYDYEDHFFDSVDYVIADEVSGATTESSWSVYLPIKNLDCRWIGFDATAEKELGDRLDIRENLSCIHSENSVYVIDFFGMSWVFDKPTGYDIDIIEISSIGLREISAGLSENEFSESSIYRNICNYIFSHREYIRVVSYIMETYGKLFIPINDLTYIETMTDIFSEKYHVATITGEGYWSSKEGWIDLDRLKHLTQENQINLLLSSASGFKGLDFRGVPNVLLTLGVKAGTVIQFVGRVARQKHFRIFTITAGGRWKLPIYTKTNIQQLKLILDYYENCNINMTEYKYE